MLGIRRCLLLCALLCWVQDVDSVAEKYLTLAQQLQGALTGGSKSSLLSKLEHSLSQSNALNRNSDAVTDFCSPQVAKATKQIKSDYEEKLTKATAELKQSYERQLSSLREQLQQMQLNCTDMV